MKILTFKARADESGLTLQNFVSAKLDLSKNGAKQIIDSRNVFVNRRRVWMSRHIIKPGDLIEITCARKPEPSSGKTKILYDDDHYLVIYKQPGMLSNGKNSIEELIQTETCIKELACAHRLDRDTSGCLLIAKNKKCFDLILPLFKQRLINKTYHAIASGRIIPETQTLKTNIDGQPAVSHIETIDSNRDASHLRARISTGRTHQIRKHLQSIHHHIMGDKVYGIDKKPSEKSIQIPRQMLHASDIAFINPISGAHVKAHATLPQDFRDCLRLFRLK